MGGARFVTAVTGAEYPVRRELEAQKHNYVFPKMHKLIKFQDENFKEKDSEKQKILKILQKVHIMHGYFIKAMNNFENKQQ